MYGGGGARRCWYWGYGLNSNHQRKETQVRKHGDAPQWGGKTSKASNLCTCHFPREYFGLSQSTCDKSPKTCIQDSLVKKSLGSDCPLLAHLGYFIKVTIGFIHLPLTFHTCRSTMCWGHGREGDWGGLSGRGRLLPCPLCILLGALAQMLSGTEPTVTLNQIGEKRKTVCKIPPMLLNFLVAATESMNLVPKTQGHFPSSQDWYTGYRSSTGLTSS